MSDYTAQINALLAALASGEKTIKVEGKETTYRDVGEIRDALKTFRSLQQEAQAESGSGNRYAATVAFFGSD